MNRRSLTFAATALACGALAPAAHAGPLGDWTGAAAEPVTPGLTEAAAATLPNGQVLLAGGSNGVGAQAAAELYTPATNAWSAVHAMSVPRYELAAATLPDGRVIAIGGSPNVPGPGDSSTEIYDPTTNSWTAGADMGEIRRSPAAAPLGDGRILVAGGFSGDEGGAFGVSQTAEIYDPASDSWSAAASMSGPRYGAAAAPLPNGDVLVAGGKAAPGGTPLASAEIYHPGSDTWTAAADMSTGRVRAVASALPGGQVLVAGGFGAGSVLSSAEIYDPGTGTWFTANPIPNGMGASAASALNDGRVLVTGGDDGVGDVSSAAYAYSSGPLLATRGLDLGSTIVGQTSAGQAVTVTNNGVERLAVTGATIDGPNAGDFAVVDNECAGQALALHASCHIFVQFAPSSTGSRQATLELTENDQAGTASAALTGTGTEPVQGPAGPPGDQGVQGVPGNPGPQGPAGPAGPSGASFDNIGAAHFPLHVISRSAVVNSRRRAPLQVVCPIATKGCTIKWAVYLKGSTVRIGEGERYLRGRVTPHVLTLVLTSRGMRMLRSRHGLTVTVHFRSREASGFNDLTTATLHLH